MKKKVYFAGSIRGGREDAAVYKRIIDYINATDTVLTETYRIREFECEDTYERR